MSSSDEAFRLIFKLRDEGIEALTAEEALTAMRLNELAQATLNERPPTEHEIADAAEFFSDETIQ